MHTQNQPGDITPAGAVVLRDLLLGWLFTTVTSEEVVRISSNSRDIIVKELIDELTPNAVVNEDDIGRYVDRMLEKKPRTFYDVRQLVIDSEATKKITVFASDGVTAIPANWTGGNHPTLRELLAALGYQP